MKKVFVQFSNHFDLIWRRCWDRKYVHQGRQYLGYRDVEALCIRKNVELAEQGKGAYMLEQALSLRAFLETHPDFVARLKALYAKGLFEMNGAGEAIIDLNMCQFETMCRNLGSGIRFCQQTFGVRPEMINHADGFGSSAQFPQVTRKTGLSGICGISYSQPDNVLWRGLDGSVVFVGPNPPGRGYFFDHCYHEPCKSCNGFGQKASVVCAECEGMGIDLPQNFYPVLEPVADGEFKDGIAGYNVCSEEMLPSAEVDGYLAKWNNNTTGIQYVWGTFGQTKSLRDPLEKLANEAPADKISTRVENNPVQTGCLVTRSRIKREARFVESLFYGWETALNLTCPDLVDRGAFEAMFLDLPLVFFHDSITGTHQDHAYFELMDLMANLGEATSKLGAATLQKAGINATAPRLEAGQSIAAFNPTNDGASPQRIPLSVADWRMVKPMVAVAQNGRRYPVVYSTHAWSPGGTKPPVRQIAAVGKDARVRPTTGRAHVEVSDTARLEWSSFKLEPAAEPVPTSDRVISNGILSVKLGENGVESVTDLARGTTTGQPQSPIGALRLDEDQGDPWGTRKPSGFAKDLARFTRLLGVNRFDGYTEAYYYGGYEPSHPFGREEDPKIFTLEWQTTVRLLDGANRLDFVYEIYWKTADRRIRAVFPAGGVADDSGYYSIPGGWLKRPRYEQTETCLWSPNGDWPALHFAASNAGDAPGWAVINYGSPAARIENGSILVSMLRSPSFGHCLERYAQDYPMPTDGKSDGGWHQFTFSFTPHAGQSDMPRLAAEAASLNQVPPVVGLESNAPSATSTLHTLGITVHGGGVELLSAKAPFADADGIVIRILNLKPVAATAIIRGSKSGLNFAREVLTTEEAINGAQAIKLPGGLELKAFEVKTLRLTKA